MEFIQEFVGEDSNEQLKYYKGEPSDGDQNQNQDDEEYYNEEVNDPTDEHQTQDYYEEGGDEYG